MTRRPLNCYVIGGSNGAGKTTFATEFLPLYANCRNFINADLLARAYSPFDPDAGMLRARRTRSHCALHKEQKELRLQRRRWPVYDQRRRALRKIAARIRAMNEPIRPTLTREAMQALTDAVAKVVEDHRRRAKPLAVWRDGKAIWIPATEAGALHETPIPQRGKTDDKRS